MDSRKGTMKERTGGGGSWRGESALAIKSRACKIPLPSDNGINWIAIGRAVVSRYSITEAAIVFRGL